MAEDRPIQFAESEDVARAKAFWHDNGKSIVAGVVLGLGGIVGFNFWNGYQQSQGEAASQMYDQLKAQTELASAVDLGAELKNNYGSTAYASIGAFTLAKILVEDGDYDAAGDQLSWVLANSKDEGIKHIARIRLAGLLNARQNYDESLNLVSGYDSGPFGARYSEIMGDAYAGRNQDGDIEKARVAYLQSLESLAENSGNATIIQLKLDNL